MLSPQVLASEPPVTAVAFSADGTRLVAVGQGGLQTYLWPTLELESTLQSSSLNLHCLEFSPDGQRLAVGGGNPAEYGGIELFAWPAGDLLAASQSLHEDCVMDLVWHDEASLVSASLDRRIAFWNTGQTQALHTLTGHSRAVLSLCLLADGQTLVSAGEDQSLRVWNLDSRELMRSMNQHTDTVHALSARPTVDGLPMIASASADRTIRFWQPTIGRMVRYVKLEAEPLKIAWLRDGQRIAAACVDGQVRIVQADEVRVIETLPAIEGWAYALAAHPTDGSLAVAGSNGQTQRLVPSNSTGL